jgi:hypothetical protein
MLDGPQHSDVTSDCIVGGRDCMSLFEFSWSQTTTALQKVARLKSGCSL